MGSTNVIKLNKKQKVQVKPLQKVTPVLAEIETADIIFNDNSIFIKN